jgi:hypothetical protein
MPVRSEELRTGTPLFGPCDVTFRSVELTSL